MKQDTIYQASYSIFDKSADLSFSKIPRNSSIIEPYMEDRATEALLWFSRGFYTAEKTADGQIIFYDLRFGRADLWLTTDGDFVWANELILDDNGTAESFNQSIPSFNTRSRNFALFWDRIWGK